jgi:hypothetical protein
MSVYKHIYRAYDGKVTPVWTRVFVLARYGFAEAWSSKITIGLFTLCLLPPIVFLIGIYLANNSIARALMGGLDPQGLPINARFFLILLEVQSWFALALTSWIAPRLITFDLADNALPILLSHPISRFGYVLGKLIALLASLSVVTWTPCLLLFAYQSYSSPLPWAAANLQIDLDCIPLHPRAGCVFVGQVESRGHWRHFRGGFCAGRRRGHCNRSAEDKMGFPAQHSIHDDLPLATIAWSP